MAPVRLQFGGRAVAEPNIVPVLVTKPVLFDGMPIPLQRMSELHVALHVVWMQDRTNKPPLAPCHVIVAQQLSQILRRIEDLTRTVASHRQRIKHSWTGIRQCAEVEMRHLQLIFRGFAGGYIATDEKPAIAAGCVRARELDMAYVIFEPN